MFLLILFVFYALKFCCFITYLKLYLYNIYSIIWHLSFKLVFQVKRIYIKCIDHMIWVFQPLETNTNTITTNTVNIYMNTCIHLHTLFTWIHLLQLKICIIIKILRFYVTNIIQIALNSHMKSSEKFTIFIIHKQCKLEMC